MYSRWNHEYNNRVHPVCHPRAIAFGVVRIWIAVQNQESPLNKPIGASKA
jgi:hypothetical protein